MASNIKYTYKRIIGVNQLMEIIKEAFPDDTILKCHVFFLPKKCLFIGWEYDTKISILFMPTTISVRTSDGRKKFPTDGLALRFTGNRSRTFDEEDDQVLEIDGTQKTYNGNKYYPSEMIHPKCWQPVFEKIYEKYDDMPVFSTELHESLLQRQR